MKDERKRYQSPSPGKDVLSSERQEYYFAATRHGCLMTTLVAYARSWALRRRQWRSTAVAGPVELPADDLDAKNSGDDEWSSNNR